MQLNYLQHKKTAFYNYVDFVRMGVCIIKMSLIAKVNGLKMSLLLTLLIAKGSLVISYRAYYQVE